jgi:hypothetical protein
MGTATDKYRVVLPVTGFLAVASFRWPAAKSFVFARLIEDRDHDHGELLDGRTEVRLPDAGVELVLKRNRDGVEPSSFNGPATEVTRKRMCGLTLELTRLRKLAKPAVAIRVQRRVRPSGPRTARRRPPKDSQDKQSYCRAADVRPKGPHWSSMHADNATKRCGSRQAKEATVPALPFGGNA